MPKLTRFFEKTYFWHVIKNKVKKNVIPIDQLLMIKEISPIDDVEFYAMSQAMNLDDRIEERVKASSTENGLVLPEEAQVD